MKQLIVLIAMMLLGVAVAAIVLSFTKTANDMSSGVHEEVTSTFEDYITVN